MVSQNEARRRKEVALARLRELEVAEREGKLITIEAAADTVTKAFSAVKAAVLRIPDKAARQVMAASNPAEGGEILRTECENALRGAHDELRRLGIE
ncbi:MAG: hypothetical protein JNL98_21265 [Bryobacterales bacterium]|nr:hypothetical protein [Bryobacterales bacterium]